LSLFLRMWRSTRCSLMTMSSSSMSLARFGRLISVSMLAACLPLPSSASLLFACEQPYLLNFQVLRSEGKSGVHPMLRLLLASPEACEHEG